MHGIQIQILQPEILIVDVDVVATAAAAVAAVVAVEVVLNDPLLPQ